jgi:hypothetical protein
MVLKCSFTHLYSTERSKGASGVAQVRGPALQEWGPELKPQYQQNGKKKKTRVETSKDRNWINTPRFFVPTVVLILLA